MSECKCKCCKLDYHTCAVRMTFDVAWNGGMQNFKPKILVPLTVHCELRLTCVLYCTVAASSTQTTKQK